ncbi:hypothetical protein AB4510_02030 [Vibrio sp. 10N.222.54.B12]|uniref:hypothetical protein n=1 Tax=unclassified Vibrio TaxID=2614977 RepID=UPI0035520615
MGGVTNNLFSLTVEDCHLKRTLDNVEEKLFHTTSAPDEGLLNSLYPIIEQKIINNNLIVDTTPLIYQRYLPWMLFERKTKSYFWEGLLTIEGAWSQIYQMLLNRMDALTMHILVSEVQSNSYGLTGDSFAKIVNDIEKLTSNDNPQRWSQIRLMMEQRQDDSNITGGWSRVVLASRANAILTTFSIFRSATHEQNADDQKLKSLNSERNEFWRQYFINGKVPYAWLVVPSKSDVTSKSGNVISTNEPLEKGIALCFQVGDYLVMEKSVLNGVIVSDLPKGGENIKQAIKRMYNEPPLIKHKFSGHGYWQYRTSSYLKKSTQFMPRRSEYLK